MSPICTSCGEPIVATDKTAKGPAGIVHLRCQKRAKAVSEYDLCPGCGCYAVSALLNCCLSCKWRGDDL